MKKVETAEIKAAYDVLKKNVDAVGIEALEKGKYAKAWERALENFRNILKTYAYSVFCGGVVGALEEDAIEDASLIAKLATIKTFNGIVPYEQILKLLEANYKSFLKQNTEKLRKMSDELNSPIFIENKLSG